ncbi:hypothetical protein DW993_11820 [Clostridium sp. AM51-4]|nr:hypothetical protein DW993_11820 [Clostridium sp. AM51-4]
MWRKRRICIRAGRCPFKRRNRPGCTQCQGYACLLRRRPVHCSCIRKSLSGRCAGHKADTDFSSFVCPRFIVGTSSPRRQCFLEECWKEVWPVNANIPEPVFQTLRGNVHTRLNKLKEGLYDGIVLAQAGLARLGICEGEEFHFYPLDPKHFIPAGGQGILAVEAKTGSPAAKLASVIDCPDAHICLDAERGVLAYLNAGCHEPVGVYARMEEGKLIIQAAGCPGELKDKKVRHVCVTGNTDRESLEKMIEETGKGLKRI